MNPAQLQEVAACSCATSDFPFSAVLTVISISRRERIVAPQLPRVSRSPNQGGCLRMLSIAVRMFDVQCQGSLMIGLSLCPLVSVQQSSGSHPASIFSGLCRRMDQLPRYQEKGEGKEEVWIFSQLPRAGVHETLLMCSLKRIINGDIF